MIVDDNTYLEHHGILGQKWGVRRFQNPDGSYKAAGKIRYSQASRNASGSGHIKEQHRKAVSEINKLDISQEKKDKLLKKEDESYKKALKNQNDTDRLKSQHEEKLEAIKNSGRNKYYIQDYTDLENENYEKAMKKQEDINTGRDAAKKALMVAGGVALTAAVAYGGYKLYKSGALDNILGKETDISKAVPTTTKPDSSLGKKLKAAKQQAYSTSMPTSSAVQTPPPIPTSTASTSKATKSLGGTVADQIKSGRLNVGTTDSLTGHSYKHDKVYDMINNLVKKGDTKYLNALNFTNSWAKNGAPQGYHTTANFKNIWNTLSKSDQNGIKKYTGNYYHDMNTWLREGKLYYPSSSKSETKMLIDQATSALEKAKLKDDTILHRGIGNALPQVLGLSSEQARALSTNPSSIIGRTFTDKGFGSSGIAQNDAWGGVKMHIFAPAGTKGMYVDPISMHSGEHEVLLQRNTSYVVKSLTKNSAGVITDIFVDIIDQTL